MLRTAAGSVVNVEDWVDERLVWDDTISELEEIVVHSGNIWRPEFAVINGYIAVMLLGPFHGAIAVPSITRCRCRCRRCRRCRGHRYAGGARQYC